MLYLNSLIWVQTGNIMKHKKIFESIDIRSLDDGTFTISVRPIEKEEKDNDGRPIHSFGRSKEMSASSPDDLKKKLDKVMGVTEEMGEETKKDPLDEFMENGIGDALSD